MIWNFCIRRPVLTTIIFATVFIFGIYGYLQMPVREFPDVEFPIVNVNVVLPGASPEVIETQVVEPLEEKLNTIEGIKQITSECREQVGTVTVEFELYRDIDVAAQDVRDRVSRARPDMADDINEPIIRKVDPDARSVMWIALTGSDRWDMVRLTDYADRFVKNRLEKLPGIGQVQIGGERKYAVRVQLDPEKLATHHLTVHDVVGVIQQENVDIPTGRLESKEREFLIKTDTQFSSAEPFNDLIITYQNGAPVRLGDVGQAVASVENDRNVARFMREKSIGLGIVKQSDANMIAVVKRVRAEIAALAEEFPPGLEYRIASDNSQYVEENINDLITTIFMATGLVILVVLSFLGSGRGTIITTIAIPTSLLAGLAISYYLGFSLNTISLLAMILVVGIVVDDAIVILESCYRHMEHGAEAKPAARTGTTEIAFAAIANSLALAAVFIPVAFMPGMIGRFFYQFGITVTLTVFSSTFVALTLTPMLCSRFLKVANNNNQTRKALFFRITEAGFQRLESLYRPLLRAALNKRFITVCIGILAFVAGIMFLRMLESEFIPSVDKSRFMIAFETVEGATVHYTDKYARKIETVLAEIPEVKTFFLAIGLSHSGPGKANQGVSFIQLVNRHKRDKTQEEVMDHIRKRLSGLSGGRAYVLDAGGPTGSESPLQVVLKSTDLNELAAQQEKIMGWMRAQPEFVGVHSNMKMDKPEVRLSIDRDKAREMGISAANIATTLRYVFGEPEISEIDRENERYEVITEINQKNSLPETIYTLYTRNSSNQMVSLANVVNLSEGVGPSAIHHFNRGRAVTINAQLPPGVAMGSALDKLNAHLDTALPPDFQSDITGRAADFKESFFYLTMALTFAIVFIYLVLAGQFESFLHPFTILMTLPLAGVGAFGALYAFDMTINIFSFIGIIMLLGLVTKNGILLVDYANILVARGETVMEAARQAALVRFRPVLMTAISTMLGMLPIALGFGAGGTSRSPMGVAITLGMLASTLLTLVVIPVIYTLFDSLQKTIIRHRRLAVAILLALAIFIAIMYGIKTIGG
ncbi:MAG: efflux RND transporter permease subunit [Thermodesulfobacteriota bacterium]|nr:efflux RND transporter permease subunit [Thermodesulfobacteriota bacterium]